MASQTQETLSPETPSNELTDRELALKLDNINIKLNRISKDMGSLAYQAKEIREILRNREATQ